MDELLELIPKTYSENSSPDEIAEAAEKIQSQYPNQEFYQDCLQIILDQEIQVSINCRKSALINYKNGVASCWKEVFDENMKTFILNQIPELLAHAPNDLCRLCEKLSDTITEYSFFNDECPYLSEILPELFQSDIYYLKAGLIISKSICKVIKNPNEKMLPLFSNFASVIFPILATICKEKDDLILLNYCYHCLSRLLITSNKITDEFIQEYGEVFYMKFMSIGMEERNSFDAIYIKFLKEGIKFLSKISDKFDNEQIDDIINFIQNVFQLPLNKSLEVVKAKAIEFLNYMVVNLNKYDVFEAHMQEIMETIFSLLIISDEEIEDMENDPVAFLQENPQTTYNWDDVKASCCRFVSNCVKESEDESLIDLIYQISSSFPLQSENRNQIFTAFRLLTTAVSEKCGEYLNQFLPNLLEAFEHEDFVIRAGAFLFLSNVKYCKISQQIIDSCINHINDPVQIVCYYAALGLSQSFYLSQDQPEYQQFKELYSPQLDQLYTLFINITSEFNDSSISEALSTFATFFNEEFLPYSIPLFDKITEIFINSCVSEGSDDTDIIMSADGLHILIKTVGKIQDLDLKISNELFDHFCSKLFTLIEELAECSDDKIQYLMQPLASLINYLPTFDPDSWQILEPLMEMLNNDIIDSEDTASVIEQLIFKDEELPSREQIVNDISTILLSSDLLIQVPTFAACLIMRCGQFLPCIEEIISGIQEAASDVDIERHEKESICNIVSSLVLNFDNYLELLGESFPSFFQIWVEEPSYPFYLASMLKIFNNFNDDVEAQAQMLKSAFDCIPTEEVDNEEKNMLRNGLVDDFQLKPGEASLSKSENPQWFNDASLAEQLLQLASSLLEAQSPVIQGFEQEEFNHNMDLLAEYHKKLIENDENIIE